MEEKKAVCPNCECELQDDDDFCPDCGTLFAEGVKCSNHEDKNAEGVCVICCQPFCGKCGSKVDDVFFCEDESGYQFTEGRASVFGSNDPEQMNIVKDVLEEKGLHPLIIYPKGRRYKSVIIGVDTDGFIPAGRSNLMVPFQEVIKAEEVLQELKLIE